MDILDAIRITEAAQLYDCCRARIYQFIETGRLPTKKFLGIATVSRQQVIALSQANKPKRDLWRESQR